MLGICANDVFGASLNHVNTVWCEQQVWNSPLINSSLDGSSVTGSFYGSMRYNIEPQLSPDSEYLLHVQFEPTQTSVRSGGDVLLSFTVEYFVIVGGYKYFLNEDGEAIFTIPKDISTASAEVTLGFDVDYSLQSADSASVNVNDYAYVVIKSAPVFLIYSIEGTTDSDSIVDSINNGNQLQQNANNLQQQENQLQQESNSLQQQENQLQQEQNNTTNSIFSSISDFFGSFFDNLIGIFVPEEGYFEEFFERLNTFFSDKLGMLYAPIDIFIEVLTAISEGGGSAGITFPQVKWREYVLIEEQTINLQSIADELGELQEYIYLGTDVIMVGSVINLLQNKLREVLKS